MVKYIVYHDGKKAVFTANVICESCNVIGDIKFNTFKVYNVSHEENDFVDCMVEHEDIKGNMEYFFSIHGKIEKIVPSVMVV